LSGRWFSLAAAAAEWVDVGSRGSWWSMMVEMFCWWN